VRTLKEKDESACANELRRDGDFILQPSCFILFFKLHYSKFGVQYSIFTGRRKACPYTPRPLDPLAPGTLSFLPFIIRNSIFDIRHSFFSAPSCQRKIFLIFRGKQEGEQRRDIKSSLRCRSPLHPGTIDLCFFSLRHSVFDVRYSIFVFSLHLTLHPRPLGPLNVEI